MAGLMPPTDEPAPTTVTIARAIAEFDLLRKIGSDCHLTGDDGDTLLCGHPTYLVDLVQARCVRLLCRQAVGWARLRTKGDFTPDHYLGLRANAAVLRELADGRLAERGLVDPDRLRRLLDHAAAGLPVAFSEFEPVLAAEIWLHAVDTAPAVTRWQPRTLARERTAS
ncbi:MAG: hypothetical protein ACRDS1_16460 [Pseudonocardiaceae bacterium]